jgi:zinc transporter
MEPMPVFLHDTAAADRGLICGFQLSANRPPLEISASEIPVCLAEANAVTWLHFNLSDARARRWLLGAQFMPSAWREVLQEHDENRRIEAVDGGLMLVMSDFTYEADSDPSEVAPLWCYASRRLLLTARMHPLKSADDLRLQLRAGQSAASGFELISQLLEVRTLQLRKLAADMLEQLNEVEDEILAGNTVEQRQQLGRVRRLCARLRRQFAPERAELYKLLNRPSGLALHEERETLQAGTDGLGFAIEEISELYERAKLLQEELGSRLAENTGRNLYVLSILTAVLLPMTLVTGIFGMNVAGLPGLQGAHSFWWVMVLILASGAVTLAALVWRRLL